MARIPAGENFGQLLPQPQRAASMPAGASGENIGAALSAAGTNELQRLDEQARAQDLEQRRQIAEARAEAKAAEAQRKAAERADASAKSLAAQDNLQLLHDDIAEGVKTGKIAKDQVDAEWARLSGEQVNTALETIPQEHRQIVQGSLQHRVAVLSRGVRKAVTQRDQTDTLAGVNQTLEYAQRLYLKDPAAADALATTTLEQLGPFTGKSAEELRAVGQRWKEGTRFTMASALVGAARRDNKALDQVSARLNSDEFADMDPQRKTTLLAQVEGFRVANEQRAEVAQRRRDALAERTLRQAEAEFTAASTLVNSGKMLSDDYVQRLTARTAGTPFAAAVPELLKQAPANSAFGSQPVLVMDQTINGLRAQLNARGTDPKTEKQIRELEGIRDAARRDYKEDPLPAALERGILPAIAPLDTSSMAAITQGLAARVEQAQVVATRTGEPVSPLLRNEAEQVAKLVTALPVDQRSTAIAELAQAAGPGIASAIGRQIAPKDKALGLAFGMAGAKTTAGRYTSELILRGAQAIKDRSVKEDNAALTGMRAQVAAVIGDAVPGEARDTLIEAAVLTNYGLMAEGSGDVQQAVRLATGGVTERAGRKVILPYGVSEQEFDRRLRGVTAQTLAKQLPDGQVYVDGKPMAAEAFAAQVPGAALQTAGNGRYYVRAGNSLATTKNGRPLVLEVR